MPWTTAHRLTWGGCLLCYKLKLLQVLLSYNCYCVTVLQVLLCYWVTSVTILLSNKCYCVTSVTTWCADRLTWPLITASATLSPLWHPPLAFALSSGSILLCISHVKCNSMPFRLFHFIVSLRDIRKGTVACHQKFWRTLNVCLLTTEKFWMGQQIQRHFPSVDMIPLSQSNLLHLNS